MNDKSGNEYICPRCRFLHNDFEKYICDSVHNILVSAGKIKA